MKKLYVFSTYGVDPIVPCDSKDDINYKVKTVIRKSRGDSAVYSLSSRDLIRLVNSLADKSIKMNAKRLALIERGVKVGLPAVRPVTYFMF